MIQVKRVYEPAAPGDGARFVVERLWTRGIRKEALSMEGWLREVAPSTALRQWFAHDPAKWEEFQRRYRLELSARREDCNPLLEAARRGPLTLLYSARDKEHNSAVVLKSYLEEHATKKVRAPATGGRKPTRR
ncbi:MAG TPA: DUF488 family protein [Candidatus Dormibacteraeota bacterium]|nr:DUF488 family protein [Candidatus Dormibacteraeota bacterium]